MLYEVVVRQTYQGRNVINRWNYNGSGVPAAVSMSFALASAFGAIPDGITGDFPDNTILWRMLNNASTDLVFVETQVTALYDVVDFYAVPYPTSQNGSQGGTAMSPFLAYALQSNRVRTDIRRGNKRFCGVTETYIGAGGIVEAGMPALLDTLAEYMSDTLEYDDEGNTLSFQPCILSYEKHAPDVDHDTEWYAPYPTNAEQLEHAALGITWQAKAYVTTQNSRKD